MTNTQQWDAIAPTHDAGAPDVVRYGRGLPDESELRLLGDPHGRRMLDLGCGAGAAAISLVQAGAHVIGIDASEAMLRRARQRADELEVTVEWRCSDLADLAFLRAEAIHAAIAVDSLGEVDDIDRVFRQVNRVLAPGGPLVFTLPHPAAVCIRVEADAGPAGGGAQVVHRSYRDPSPVVTEVDGQSITRYPRTIEEVFAALHRASFRVDHILEPEVADGTPGEHGGEDGRPAIPPAVIWRARKQGS